MKCYPIILLLICNMAVYSQTVIELQPHNEYKRSLENYLKQYSFDADGKNNMVIQPKLLDEKIDNYFNTVVFSGSNTVSSASAFGAVTNEEKTTISSNANLNFYNPIFLTVGVNAIGGGNIFNLYEDGAWYKSVGGSVGFIVKLKGSSYIGKTSETQKQKELSGLLDPKDEMSAIRLKIEKWNELRKLAASDPLIFHSFYSKEGIDSIGQLKRQILNLPSGGLVSDYPLIYKVIPNLKTLLTQNKLVEAYELLAAKEKDVEEFLKHKKGNDFKDYIQEKFYEFDKNHDLTFGYILNWIRFNYEVSNATYSFNEKNVKADILEEFISNFGSKNQINRLNSRLSLNFNRTSHSSRIVYFLQGGIAHNSFSFLESGFVKGTPTIFKNSTGNFSLEDEEGSYFGDYDFLKEDLDFGEFELYGALFFTKNKNFGVNASGKHYYLISKPSGSFYRNNFTFLAGPIFRSIKDGNTVLTFGIDIGWENAIYNTKISNDFTAKIRLGVPFNIAGEKSKS